MIDGIISLEKAALEKLTEDRIASGSLGEEVEDILSEAGICWGTEARKYWDSNYSDEPEKTIEVQGSKGKTYKVTKTGPSWKCECRGFQFRQDCKHIQNLKILIEG